MARQIDLDQLMKYPLRRGSEHCDEKNADPRFLNGVESILEWAQTFEEPPYPVVTQEVIDRLAAIEDILGEEYDLDRLCELAQADQEGGMTDMNR